MLAKKTRFAPSELVGSLIKTKNGYRIVDKNHIIFTRYDKEKFIRTMTDYGWNFTDYDRYTIYLMCSEDGEINGGIFDCKEQTPITKFRVASKKYRPCDINTYLYAEEEIKNVAEIIKNT